MHKAKGEISWEKAPAHVNNVGTALPISSWQDRGVSALRSLHLGEGGWKRRREVQPPSASCPVLPRDGKTLVLGEALLTSLKQESRRFTFHWLILAICGLSILVLIITKTFR